MHFQSFFWSFSIGPIHKTSCVPAMPAPTFDEFDEPGRPHMRDGAACRRFASCFRWHFAAAATLVSIFGAQRLQVTAIGKAGTYSAHCAGTGPDKLIVNSFLAPALAAHGVKCNLQSVFSVAAQICYLQYLSGVSCSLFRIGAPSLVRKLKLFGNSI